MPYYSGDYKLLTVKYYIESKNYVKICDILFGCKRILQKK